jgi:hypothetical protein
VAQPLNPRRELCGCEFCEAGSFPFGNPNGVIPIPDAFLDEAPPGFTVIPCSLLDFAGQSGQIPPDLCNDELRLLDEFRTICGCPALPARITSSPVSRSAVSRSPVSAAPVQRPTPTMAPIAVGPPTPPTIHDTCEICGCDDCTPGQFPLGNPTGTIPIPPEFLAQAPPGFTVIPCSLLDLAGQTGQIPNDLCTDALRLLPEFRQICGCPPLPGAASSTPSGRPSSSPRSAPVAVTLMPVLAPEMPMAPITPTTNAPVNQAPVNPAPAPQIRPTAGHASDDDDDVGSDKKSGEGYKLDGEFNKYESSERSASGKGKRIGGERCGTESRKSKGGKGKKKAGKAMKKAGKAMKRGGKAMKSGERDETY